MGQKQPRKEKSPRLRSRSHKFGYFLQTVCETHKLYAYLVLLGFTQQQKEKTPHLNKNL